MSAPSISSIGSVQAHTGAVHSSTNGSGRFSMGKIASANGWRTDQQSPVRRRPSTRQDFEPTSKKRNFQVAFEDGRNLGLRGSGNNTPDSQSRTVGFPKKPSIDIKRNNPKESTTLPAAKRRRISPSDIAKPSNASVKENTPRQSHPLAPSPVTQQPKTLEAFAKQQYQKQIQNQNSDTQSKGYKRTPIRNVKEFETAVKQIAAHFDKEEGLPASALPALKAATKKLDKTLEKGSLRGKKLTEAETEMLKSLGENIKTIKASETKIRHKALDEMGIKTADHLIDKYEALSKKDTKDLPSEEKKHLKILKKLIPDVVNQGEFKGTKLSQKQKKKLGEFKKQIDAEKPRKGSPPKGEKSPPPTEEEEEEDSGLPPDHEERMALIKTYKNIKNRYDSASEKNKDAKEAAKKSLDQITGTLKQKNITIPS